MSLARPTSTVARGSGVAPDSGPTSAWVTTTQSDVAHAAGSYTTTFEASSVSGFAHKIIINDRGDTNFLDQSTYASVYVDTGISYASLAAKKNTIVGVVMETDYNISDYDTTNTNAFLCTGVYVGDSTTFANNSHGAASGLVMTGSTGLFFRPLSNVMRFGTDTNLGTGMNTFSDYASGDTHALAQIRLDGTLRQKTESGSESAGLQGASITFAWYEDDNKAKFLGDRHDLKRQITRIGTGNLVLGAFFGQRRTGGSAGMAQTINFNLIYVVESRD
tara:strand:- start:12877 stop:13704 length:828 start_codon:yes stop_codon:yes gene_type:complete